MNNDARRQAALARIQQNIDAFGQHIYVVSGVPEPRFAYSIGLSRSVGFEVILAGAVLYLLSDVTAIINAVSCHLQQETAREGLRLEMPPFGRFTLGTVHASWSNALLLGALDFYQATHVPALQIVPDEAHKTIDVPDLSEPWSSATAPAWRWVKEAWELPVPKHSMALTDTAALFGARITEVARWEDDYWEMFAAERPNVDISNTRVVPLGLLLTADQSLKPVLELTLGCAFWRDQVSDWHPMKTSTE